MLPERRTQRGVLAALIYIDCIQETSTTTSCVLASCSALFSSPSLSEDVSNLSICASPPRTAALEER